MFETLLLAALLVYVVTPMPPLQLAAIGVGGWAALRRNSGAGNGVLLGGLAAATYAAAFLLNPISLTLAKRFGAPPTLYQGLLASAGALWLVAALPRQGRPLRRSVPDGRFLLAWTALFLVCFLPGWSADIAYGGDEGYHRFSISVARLQLASLWARPTAWMAGLAWLVAGWWLARRRAGRARLALWCLCGLSLAAALAPWGYPAELIEHPVARARTYRFPAAQPWLSAGMGAATLGHWGGERILDDDLARLLPLLLLYGAGLFLGADRRLRGRSPVLAGLAVLGLLTVPTLLYHGSLLYLDLPLVVLGLVLACDLEAWLTAPADRLPRRCSWWAAILLGFTKVGALPILLLLVGWRGLRWLLRREPLGAELRLIAAVMLPMVIYMALRVGFRSRPYAGQYANLLDPGLWALQGRMLLLQLGALLPLAAFGAAAAWRAGRRAAVLGAACWVIGLALFLMAEARQYVGLARLNLLMLPPLLWLGLEGLLQALRRPVGGGLVLALLLGSNLLLAPMDLQGRRADWGGSGERWYPYRACMRELRDAHPRARVLLGNMEYSYAVGVQLNHLGWRPESIADTRPLIHGRPQENLAATLAHARRSGYDTVIYRQGDDAELLPGGSGFRLIKRYPARLGGLLLYRR